MSLLVDLEEIPNEPGVYLIKDKNDIVVYVGKAKNLKNRVKQHFQPSSHQKEERIQESAHRVNWVITRNESEALILEKKLVRELSPKFNSMLKDDKSNLLLRLSLEENYPQLLFARETDTRVKKSVYFGPFPYNTMLRQTAKLVLRLFPICNCGRDFEKIKQKGTSVRCMRERLGRCLAPWKNDISPEEYGKTVKNVISFLNGDVASLLDNLDEEMWEASNQSNFEKAVTIRDLTTAVRTILNMQEDLHSKRKDVDILSYTEEDNHLAFCKMEIRNYRVYNIKTFIVSDEEKDLLTTSGKVLTFIYGKDKPKQIIWVEKKFTDRFVNDSEKLVRFSRGESSKQLVTVAEKNARNDLMKFLREMQYYQETENVLEKMEDSLNLPIIPNIIHGFDISTLKGQYSVGSCVVFVDGEPKKSLYRRFRIRKTYTEPDDYAMMEEVISRKYLSKMLKDDPLPDLLVIDGGRGQLNIALAVLEKLQLSIPAISIAKKNEEIFVNWFEDPLTFDQSSPVLRLIQHIRDEAHRFAISYHRTLRRITVKETIFERIKGIGKAKVQILFHEFKNLNRIADADIEDIQKLLSVNEEIARQVIDVAKQSLTKNYYANK